MSSISEADSDILRLLNEAELKDLIGLYKSKGDRYHCMSIYNHCRWRKKVEEDDGNISGKWKLLIKTYYTHRRGDLATNGTYISLQRDKLISIQFHTLEESLQEVIECLTETRLIDWKTGPLLTAIHSDFVDKIVESIKTLGGVVDYEIPCTCFVLSRSSALQIEVPSVSEEYEQRHLKEEHADFVHANWPHNDEASVDFIRGMIKFNSALGIFRLSDEALVGWIFQNEFYGLGILQVIPEEQGKGLAKILIKAMSKQIAQHDENDIIAFAVVDNAISESLLTKAGFQKSCVTKWVQLKKL